MGSIVLELQRDALDRNVRVSDLLRKALVVAKKLGITELESWISKELNGYAEGTEIPTYRIMTGQVQVWNPYHGWQPVVFGDPTKADLLSKRPSGQGIAEIESLAREDKTDTSVLAMPFPPRVEKQLLEATDAPSPPTLIVQLSGLRRILDTVRTIVLNWALKVEQDGILGEGLSFTPTEKATASKTSYTITNFYGPVGHSQIQQDSPQAVQVAAHPELDMEKVRELVRSLRASIPELQLPRNEEAELRSDLETLESQAASPRPKVSIIRESLSSLRRILEGAAGGAAARVLLELGSSLW